MCFFRITVKLFFYPVILQTMSKTRRHQQEALWEFVHTELTYINKLVVVKDVIIHCFVETEFLFSSSDAS